MVTPKKKHTDSPLLYSLSTEPPTQSSTSITVAPKKTRL